MRLIASRTWRIAGWVAGVAIIVIAVRQLVAGWSDIADRPLQWRIQPLLLLLAVLAVWAMYALLIQAWRTMLAAWGGELPLGTAARIWTVSSLGKYLPGKLWAIAGMAVMARRAGIAPWAAAGSAVILQALAIGTGAAITGMFGSQALAAHYPWVRVLLPLLALASALGVTLLLWPRFVRRLLRVARVDAPATVPGPAVVAAGAVANLVAWCGYGAAFWLLGHGLLELPGLTIGRAITAFAASYVAGLLFLPAPGGIGVRESVILLMLGGPLGAPAASALAVASRLLLTLTELGAAAPFLILNRERLGAES